MKRIPHTITVRDETTSSVPHAPFFSTSTDVTVSSCCLIASGMRLEEPLLDDDGRRLVCRRPRGTQGVAACDRAFAPSGYLRCVAVSLSPTAPSMLQRRLPRLVGVLTPQGASGLQELAPGFLRGVFSGASSGASCLFSTASGAVAALAA